MLEKMSHTDGVELNNYFRYATRFTRIPQSFFEEPWKQPFRNVLQEQGHILPPIQNTVTISIQSVYFKDYKKKLYLSSNHTPRWSLACFAAEESRIPI